jgi:hypothetical protein
MCTVELRLEIYIDCGCLYTSISSNHGILLCRSHVRVAPWCSLLSDQTYQSQHFAPGRSCPASRGNLADAAPCATFPRSCCCVLNPVLSSPPEQLPTRVRIVRKAVRLWCASSLKPRRERAGFLCATPENSLHLSNIQKTSYLVLLKQRLSQRFSARRTIVAIKENLLTSESGTFQTSNCMIALLLSTFDLTHKQHSQPGFSMRILPIIKLCIARLHLHPSLCARLHIGLPYSLEIIFKNGDLQVYRRSTNEM